MRIGLNALTYSGDSFGIVEFLRNTLEAPHTSSADLTGFVQFYQDDDTLRCSDKNG